MRHAEIASSYANWSEYFDADGVMTKAEFDATPMEQRLKLLDDAFGQEESCECIYEHRGHTQGEGECPYGPTATASHSDGVVR